MKNPPNLSEAYRGYRISKQSDGYSEGTLVVYDWTMGKMISFLEDPRIDQITLEDLRSFMLHMRVDYKTRKGKMLSGSSLDNVWKGIRSFYGWAEEALEITRPDLRLPRPTYQSKEVLPFTKAEVQALIQACTHTRVCNVNNRTPHKRKRKTALRDKALIVTLVDTGIRVSEALRLNIEDVDLDAGNFRVVPCGSGQKTKPRHVPLGKSSKNALWRYLIDRKPEPHEPLFSSRNGISPMARVSVFHLVQGLGEKAGVDNAHPHRFRHTFALEYLRNGGDVFTLQGILGHSTLKMAMHYLHISQSDFAAAHRIASPADRWRL